MATTYRGEELKDSYPIRGHALLRLVTDKGVFDYSIPVNTTADAVPF